MLSKNKILKQYLGFFYQFLMWGNNFFINTEIRAVHMFLDTIFISPDISYVEKLYVFIISI